MEGIEVSYHACGVLAHLMSDGPEAWTIDQPERWGVRKRMLSALREVEHSCEAPHKLQVFIFNLEIWATRNE